MAIAQYEAITKRSYDVRFGGYTEAFTRDWQDMPDLRLSEKDANEKKSMNTHLHVMEAFTSLAGIWPNEELKQRLEETVHIFQDHIIDKQSGHLKLFFDEDWNSGYNLVSYGHDIEAAWLLEEAAEATGNGPILAETRLSCIQLATAAAEGLDDDGGLWYEYDADTGHLVKQKHNWPQAEAMVGFFNTWQLTADEKWLNHSLQSWTFIKEYIRDAANGEWYWGVLEDHSPMLNEDKAGPWKCPYHNSRACMEILKRVETVIENNNRI